MCEDKGVERGGEIEPRFYTLEQTASYLNVSVPQVYSLVRSGRLPAIKIDGRGQWRVPVAKLEEYVERLLDETQKWTQSHPLNPRDEEPEDE